jgi:PAS domain S-box-containing protein
VDRRLWLTIGPAALLVGLGAGALILTSDQEGSKAAMLAVVLPVGWAFVAAGLVAWSREPANRVGRLMVLAGFTWFLVALSVANWALVFTVGMLVFPVTYAVVVHLLLAYPSGRLSSRSDIAVVVLAYLAATVFRLPFLFFFRTPNSDCLDCPENLLLISDEPDLASALDLLASGVAVGLLAWVIVKVVRRWRSATPRARRALGPVLVSGGAVLAALVVALVLYPISEDAAVVTQWVGFALLVTVPAAFLAGLLRTRLATAGASRLLLETPTTPTPAEAQAALRRALGDPTLELAHWLPERDGYVDTAGNPVELPPDGEGRMTTLIDYDGRPVAALVHDESLRREPELVDAVAAAARVAIEKDRLQAELHANLDELQRERDFVRAVVDTAPAFFCILDLEGRVVRCNATGRRMTGITPEDVNQHLRAADLFAVPGHKEELQRLVERAIAGGGSAETETEIVRAGGGTLLLAWSSKPIVDAQGRPRLLITGIDVTERKRQELELERERDFGHAVTDTTPSFLVIVDDEGRIAEGGVNTACEDAVGLTEAELVGRRFVNVFTPPEEHAVVIEKLGQAGHGEPVEHEGPWLGRDGRKLWVAWSCRPLLGEGTRRSFLVCGTDVTERRRHERELQRERDVLNTIADTAPGLMLIVDQSGRFTDEGLNAPAGRILGRTDAEVVDSDFVELLVAPEDAARARAHFERSVASREPTELDSTWVTRSGDRLRVAWSATWLAQADDGVRDLFLVAGADVTERERQAAELQQERDFLYTIANSARSFLGIVDAEERFVGREALNVAARSALGYSPGEVLGRSFVDVLFEPGDAETARRALAQTVAEGTCERRDAYWLTRSGERLLVEWSLTRLGPDPGSGLMLCLLTGMDVTERKRHEEELRASRARIVEAADFERRRLERNLHDGAQQRLVTLSLTLRLVETRLGRDSDAARLLAGARDELALALEELRDLARGIHPAVLSDHGLGAALDALASRVPVPVRIDTAVEGRLPEPVEVAAYYVVSESLANIAKYAQASQVTIGVAAEDGHTVVEVSDDGVGGADAGGGSGLRGLADRVEALGGRLEIQSATGAGTTVRAVIPSTKD